MTTNFNQLSLYAFACLQAQAYYDLVSLSHTLCFDKTFVSALVQFPANIAERSL